MKRILEKIRSALGIKMPSKYMERYIGCRFISNTQCNVPMTEVKLPGQDPHFHESHSIYIDGRKVDTVNIEYGIVISVVDGKENLSVTIKKQ